MSQNSPVSRRYRKKGRTYPLSKKIRAKVMLVFEITKESIKILVHCAVTRRTDEERPREMAAVSGLHGNDEGGRDRLRVYRGQS